jgi:uncharacterized protein (TIGR02246 family)
MTFRDTLDRHLQAIQDRDLGALIETLPADGLTLVMADGRLVRSVQEFVDLHRKWFAQPTWSLEVESVQVTETADVGVALLYLDYHDVAPDGRAIHESSYLTLIFARRDGKWVMVHDQNTPVRKRS